MRDPRLDKLAKVLVNYSVELKKGDVVSIQGAPVAEPLIVAVYRAALEAGAHPHVRMAPDELTEILLKNGSREQLEFVSPLTMHEMETVDARIGLWAEVNTRALTNTDSAKHAQLSAARKPIMAKFMERAAKKELRWTGTMFPTQSSAQDAGMSLSEYEDFVFGAGLLDHADPVTSWKKVAEKQQRIVDLLNGGKELHLTAANGTDLRMNLEERVWINCCGKENFPDGEVFTAPREDSVDGVIRFSFPAVHMGHECEGVELHFKQGKVVEAKAEKGQDFLFQMLDQDEGARRVGEFAIGTNYGVKQFTRNTLFDEKIGGTVHLAVGMAYPERGGKNESGLQWEMVCDLRGGGCIALDGKTVYENGAFAAVDLTI